MFEKYGGFIDRASKIYIVRRRLLGIDYCSGARYALCDHARRDSGTQGRDVIRAGGDLRDFGSHHRSGIWVDTDPPDFGIRFSPSQVSGGYLFDHSGSQSLARYKRVHPVNFNPKREFPPGFLAGGFVERS